ncbi:MAG: hypothetical protein AAGA54_12800 [Myxococcota bacterium]
MTPLASRVRLIDTGGVRWSCSSVLASVLALALALVPLRAKAAPPLLEDATAQEALDAGLERFYAEDFDAASTYFSEAYTREPAPFLLYSWAMAERYAGRCPKAITLLERFLSTSPPEDEAAKARKTIVDCGGIPPVAVAPQPDPPEPAPQPEAPPPPRNDPPTTEPTAPPPGRVSLGVGIGLGVVGLALGATGSVVFAGGARLREDAPAEPDQQRYVDALAQGERRQQAGATVAIVGGAVLVTGVALLAVGLRRRSSRVQANGPGLTLRF